MSGFDITGRVAIVTGGSKGIGFGMALDLAEAGADVAVVSRNLDEGEAAAEEIRKRGRKGLAICADVRIPADCDMLVSKTVEQLGRLDILVNCAGTNIRKPLVEFTEEEWLSDPERYDAIISRSAIKRLGERDDLRGMLLLLISDASSYITGHTFYVDGGALAGWPVDW